MKQKASINRKMVSVGKVMKHALTVLLCLAIVIALLVGCSKDLQSPQAQPDQTVPTDIISTAPSIELDQYQTSPVPEGEPSPVEPQKAEVDKKVEYHCTISISAATILNNRDRLDPAKAEVLPSDGVIVAEQTVAFYEGESVFDVLLRATKDQKIHMEFSSTPVYNSKYIEGIHNLYEFDCGELSGWMYKVNGWFPNYGCSRYQLQEGDTIEWLYTCDLGRDIGGDYAQQNAEGTAE